MQDTGITVSVCVLAYNHENYIRQCLDGILSQKIDFPIEIIIHDDASTDQTADIIREYEQQYPNIIKPIYQVENQYSKGIKISITYQYPRVQGKYIALCEGDDYWTNPNKLQKQVDFMEEHPDVSMTFHDALVVNENGNQVRECNSRYKKDQYALMKDLITEGGWFCPTASIILRSEYMQTGYPAFCVDCHVGDYPLQLYMGVKGRVFYFAEKMSVYRYQIPGSWTNSSQNVRADKKEIKKWITELRMLEGIDNLTDYRYHKIISSRQFYYLTNQILKTKKTDRKKIIQDLNIYVDKFSLVDRLIMFSLASFYPLIFIGKFFFKLKNKLSLN